MTFPAGRIPASPLRVLVQIRMENWVGKDSTAIAGVNVDIGKSGNPLNLWGMELGWTVVELAAAQQVGRPIDTQKYDGMQLKWQMDNDEQVYVGDSALNLKGLVTLDGVPVNNAAKTWAISTPDEIRASINQVLSDAWAASGYSVVPRDLLIPPEQFALLSSIIVSSAVTSPVDVPSDQHHQLSPERCSAEYPRG